MGYRPGFKAGQLTGARLLYLLGAVSVVLSVYMHVHSILVDLSVYYTLCCIQDDVQLTKEDIPKDCFVVYQGT